MILDMGKKGTSSIIVLFIIIVFSFLAIQISEFVTKVQADVDKLQIGTTSQSAQTFVGTPELQAGMHITGGNLGIGTTNPGAKLEVGSVNTEDIIKLSSTGDGGKSLTINYNEGPNIWYFDMDATRAIDFRQNEVSALKIHTDGNVGIGTTAPGQKLEVSGNIKLSAVYPFISLDGGGSTAPPAGLGYGIYGISGVGLGLYSAHTSIAFTTGNPSNIEAMRIVSGNVGIGTASPGQKLTVAGSYSGGGKYHYEMNRSIGNNTNDWVELGYTATNGQGMCTDITIRSHGSEWLAMQRYTVCSTPHGTRSTWYTVLPRDGTVWSSSNNWALDAMHGPDFNSRVYLRIRKLWGTTAAGLNITIDSLGPFTETSGTGSGGTVAGNFGNEQFNFSVGQSNFGASEGGLFIRPNGKVGIGTVSPGEKLEVYGNAGTAIIKLHDPGTNSWRMKGDANFHIYDDSGTDYLTILNNGSVGIGTNAPVARLSIYGNTYGALALPQGGDVGSHGAPAGYNPLRMYESWGWNFTLQNDGSSAFRVQPSTSSSYNHTAYFVVTRSARVGINDITPDYTLDVVGSLYVGGSSRRYKENIKDIEIDSEKIYKLRPVSYDFKEEHKTKGMFLGKGRQIGIIAEEVYDVIPELAIREEEGGLVSDTDYEKLAVVMLPEVQKHEKKINLLSKIVDTVTKTINATLVKTKKLIVDGVDILKKLNELSDKIEKQQIEINALKEKVKKLQQVN